MEKKPNGPQMFRNLNVDYLQWTLSLEKWNVIYENKISVIGFIMSCNKNLLTDMPNVQDLEVFTNLMHLLSPNSDGWSFIVRSGVMISLGLLQDSRTEGGGRVFCAGSPSAAGKQHRIQIKWLEAAPNSRRLRRFSQQITDKLGCAVIIRISLSVQSGVWIAKSPYKCVSQAFCSSRRKCRAGL